MLIQIRLALLQYQPMTFTQLVQSMQPEEKIIGLLVN